MSDSGRGPATHGAPATRSHNRAVAERTDERAAAFDAAPDAMLIVDDAGVCASANRAARVLFDARAQSRGVPLVGTHLSRLLDGTLGEPFETWWDSLLRDGERRVDGQLALDQSACAIVEIVATAEIVAGRHLVSLRVAPGRTAAESELQILESLWRTSDEAIVAASSAGFITTWNHGAELLFGYSAQEAIGQPRSLLIPPEEYAAAQEQWQRFTSPSGAGRGEFVRLTKDGRRVTISSSYAPILDRSGEVVGAISISHDVTDQKERDAALAAAHAKALEASRLRTEFIANMNHELRTPMNGVIGIAHLLADTDLDEEQRGYVDALNMSGEALLAVISDVLDFSKIEADKLILEEAPFDIRALVEDVRSIVTLGAPQPTAPLTSSFDADVPQQLIGDRDRIRQVLLNLTNNAVKFTDSGEIAINAHWSEHGAGNGELRIEVSDTGIGIEESAQARIFKSFAQADGSTTRRYGGTGLGLTIAKELVELMGGEIGVRSTPGEGSTFWFTIPLPDAAGERALVETADPLLGLEGARVIVVHGDGEARSALEAQFHSWEVTVATAADGDGALDALRLAARAAQPYDVALLDSRLAAQGGLVATIRADELLASLRIVALAPAGGTSDLPGVDGLVTKPASASELYAEIVRVIDAPPQGIDGVGPAGIDPPSEEAQAQAQAQARARVLVAEDNPINQLVAVRLLETRGFAVDVALDGREAVDMHSQAPYDAIFMDCQMPELDGYEATDAIRRHDGEARHTPIIAVTANTMPGDEERCLAAGMDGFIGKPISAAKVDEGIARFLLAS